MIVGSLPQTDPPVRTSRGKLIVAAVKPRDHG
jgi:hypothetical protein